MKNKNSIKSLTPSNVFIINNNIIIIKCELDEYHGKFGDLASWVSTIATSTLIDFRL